MIDDNYDSRWPHGYCECREGCQCKRGSPGPVVYLVSRNGRKMRVCTRCILGPPYDSEIELIARPEDPIRMLLDYDPLGFYTVVLKHEVEKVEKKD